MIKLEYYTDPFQYRLWNAWSIEKNVPFASFLLLLLMLLLCVCLFVCLFVLVLCYCLFVFLLVLLLF